MIDKEAMIIKVNHLSKANETTGQAREKSWIEGARNSEERFPSRYRSERKDVMEMSPLEWGLSSLRTRGLSRTVAIMANVLMDLLFDSRHGTETMTWVGVDSLDTSSANRARAVGYQATKARPFVKLLSKLGLPKDSVFVDLGAGKGRVLLLASQYGFMRVVGVEFCSRLCAQARHNLKRFRPKRAESSAIDVVEADVARYRIKEDENVFFMYNPFDSVVLAQVLENIRESVQQRPRPLWLIYSNPVHYEVIENVGLFAQSQVFEIGGTEFKVYTNQNELLQSASDLRSGIQLESILAWLWLLAPPAL